MARKKRATAGRPSETGVVAIAEHKLEGFAEDLGRLLGHAQNKAESWLGQRDAIAKHLTDVRDSATRLLAQLGIGEAPRRGRPAKARATRGSARPSSAATVKRGPGRPPKKKFTMSAEARARISAAQKARWAKQKRAKVE